MQEDNKPYITIVNLFGSFRVNKMEWDSRAGGYQVSITRSLGTSRVNAVINAREWAEQERIECRIPASLTQLRKEKKD